MNILLVFFNVFVVVTIALVFFVLWTNEDYKTRRRIKRQIRAVDLLLSVDCEYEKVLRQIRETLMSAYRRTFVV